MNLYQKTGIPWRCSFLLLFSFFSGTDFCPPAAAADFLSSAGSYDILFLQRTPDTYHDEPGA